MKKMESNLRNMVQVLCIIAVAAAAALGIVNAITASQIEKINAENLKNGIKEVLGATEDSLEVNELADSTFTIYQTVLGTAVKTQSNGFGGPIEVLVGFAEDGSIKGYKILSHTETPGLGAKASEWFQAGQKGDIIGKNPAEVNMTVSKDGGDIDAITASTITSRAFLKAVQAAYNKIYTGNTDAESGASKQAKKGEEE